MEGVAHLFVGGVRLAHEEVVTDCAADQRVALRNVDDVAACSRRGLYGLAGAVVFDGSLVRREEGEHESYQSALADAGLAHDGCHGAWTEVVGEVFDDVSVAVRVAEGDAFEADSELSFEPDRFAFFFLRKVKLAETVDRGYRVDQRRYLLGYLGDRALDLADELEEGGHGSEGYGVGGDAGYAPAEGGHVACGEGQRDHRAGEEVVVVPVDGLSLEVFLVASEGVYGVVGVFQRRDQGPVLDILLHVGLYAAVGLADFAGEVTHALDIGPAEEEGYRHDDDHYRREAPVHGAEEKEGGQQLESGGYDRRHGAGERVGDARDVAFEAVEHVTGVECFLACPAAFHDLDEEGVFEGVPDADLCLCLQSADYVVEEELGDSA